MEVTGSSPVSPTRGYCNKKWPAHLGGLPARLRFPLCVVDNGRSFREDVKAPASHSNSCNYISLARVRHLSDPNHSRGLPVFWAFQLSPTLVAHVVRQSHPDLERRPSSARTCQS